MLDKKNKALYRADLFRHLDGLVTAPIAYTLHQSGITRYLVENGRTNLKELSSVFKANEGYLNVALRTLASQGWLKYELDKKEEVLVQTIDRSNEAFNLFSLYKDVVDLLHFSAGFHHRRFEQEPFRKLAEIFKTYQNRYGISTEVADSPESTEYQILKHIEGHLIGPTTVHLGMGGMFHKYFMEASFSAAEYHRYPESFEVILDFLTSQGWFGKNNGHYSFKEKGLFFARRASAYGVTVSYLPMFRKLDELLFGPGDVLWQSEGTETHVDREMNVWGSGGAHTSYFKKVDEIVVDLFNRPLDEQPKGIVDMGCGNGAFLIHLFELIEKHTLRGQVLEEQPLFLVGADFNEAALKVTRANLIQADIWAKVIWGDISQPTRLNNDLKDQYGIELNDLLSVRSFLDHNRPWAESSIKMDQRERESSGAFAHRGKRLLPSVVQNNLKAHFLKWAPHFNKFGLIVIELHSIAADLASNHIGRTAATAYEATHGFSDQYIAELDVFLEAIGESGLESDVRFFSKFPNSELATVSVHYLKNKQS